MKSMTTSIQPRKSNLRGVIGVLNLTEGHLSEIDINDTADDINIKKDMLILFQKYRNLIEIRKRNKEVQKEMDQFLIKN